MFKLKKLVKKISKNHKDTIFISNINFFLLIVVSGVAIKEDPFEIATPILFVPKSKAKTC